MVIENPSLLTCVKTIQNFTYSVVLDCFYTREIGLDFSTHYLKSLDYHNREYEFLYHTPCDQLDNCFEYSRTFLNELWTIFGQCLGQFCGQFVNAVCLYIINTPTPLVTSWSLIISLVSLQ